jgi:hypothetical protein
MMFFVFLVQTGGKAELLTTVQSVQSADNQQETTVSCVMKSAVKENLINLIKKEVFKNLENKIYCQ